MMYPEFEVAKRLIEHRVKDAHLYRITHQETSNNPREGVILPKLLRRGQSR